MENKNSYTEVTNQSWGSRIVGSIKSVLFGIVLFFAAFVVLWWNEGRSVRTAKGLEEGAGQVVHAEINSVNKANNGKLIHLSGKIESGEILKDEEFGIEVQALKLSRNVEMYQWTEEATSKKEKKVGGSEETTTTYNYKKMWAGNLINSSDFKIGEGHTNPSAFPYNATTKQVNQASIGKFTLSNSLLSDINNFNDYSISKNDSVKIENAKVFNEGDDSKVYIGKGTNAQPEIGDVKVGFEVIVPGDYSIIAKQVNNSFEKFNTSTGTSIQIISPGIISPEIMFEEAQQSNIVMAWILRVVGFLMMFIGLTLIFKPLVVLADVLPFLGSLLSMGISLFAGIISFTLSFLTIAIAWVFYRPILGISLLIVGIAVFVFFYLKASSKKQITQQKQE